MKIGIIGAGQIGGTLTRRLTALGHQVVVANSRGPETLSDLAAETGATAVSVPEAVRGVDLVVVTIPEKNISDLPPGLFAATPDRVVVIDTGNYYPRQRDGRIEAIASTSRQRGQTRHVGRDVSRRQDRSLASAEAVGADNAGGSFLGYANGDQAPYPIPAGRACSTPTLRQGGSRPRPSRRRRTSRVGACSRAPL